MTLKNRKFMFKNPESGLELPRELSVEAPPIESLLDPERAAQAWPEKIAADKNFIEQIEARKKLLDNLEAVTSRLPRPDMALEDAINGGRISEDQVSALYSSLSGLLEKDSYAARLVLYLPFEFLPDKSWQPESALLQEAAAEFRRSYLKAWQGLLETYDARANFVDGDIPEDDASSGALPRVVKAAHLIPILVQKNLLETAKIIQMMEESDDDILKNSLADALPVLADLGLLANAQIEQMEKSPDQLVRAMARIITAERKSEKPADSRPSREIAAADIKEKLDREFAAIEKEDFGQITQRRHQWLKEKKKQEAIEAAAEDIKEAIAAQRLPEAALAEFLSPATGLPSQQALIEGIRKAVELAAEKEPSKGAATYAEYKTILTALWEKGSGENKDVLAKAFRRLNQTGLLGGEELAELNITVPKLAGPFSENLKMAEADFQNIKREFLELSLNPEFSRLIYPVWLVYGSRLKGYGAGASDNDFAIFVRPGIKTEEMAELRKSFEERFRERAAEFWLEEKNGQLEILEPAEEKPWLGRSDWAHVLFGAVWEGDKKSIEELREKLLVPYLRVDSGKKLNLCLERLEIDSLQYRLMHKGYDRFFPPCGGLNAPHSADIDGQSLFYDSGYRQLAARLFLSRVFLPQLAAPKR